MIENNYIESITNSVSDIFYKIYIVDTLKDLIFEYKYLNERIECINTMAFTSFYSDLNNKVHPDDIKGYIDSLNINTIEASENGDIRYKYREGENGKYKWYTNITKVINNKDNRKVVLVLIEELDDNKSTDDKSKKEQELEKKEKMIFDRVCDTLQQLNRIININCTSHNPEIKSITEYMNGAINELVFSFPEISERMGKELITNANEGEKAIIIVDDDAITRNILERAFKDLYKIIVCDSGKEVINILEKNYDSNSIDKKYKIIGLFLDLSMPEVTGFDVLDYMNGKNLINRLPVVIISGDNHEEREKAYMYPIADVLEKPFNINNVKHRMLNLIKLYKANNSLNEIVMNQHEDIKNVLRLLVKSYMIDCDQNIKKMCAYMHILMLQVSNDYNEYKIDNQRIDKITEATKYYNIGLFTLPKTILNKTKFNKEELQIIKSHPQIGINIFESVLYHNTDIIFNQYAEDIILYHEEKYDGTGYPSGLKKEEIPIVAQVLSVIIEYNDLKLRGINDIYEKIKKESGYKFNPKVVDSLGKVLNEFEKISKM